MDEEQRKRDEHIKKLEKKLGDITSELTQELRVKQIKESPVDFLFNVLFTTVSYQKVATEDCFLIVEELIKRFEELDHLDPDYRNIAKLTLLLKQTLKKKRREIAAHRDDLVQLSTDLLKLERTVESSLNEEKD